MLGLLEKFDNFVDYIYSLEDPRTKDFLFLERRPYALIFILISYVLLIKLGPKWMEKREPFQLKLVMTIYNLFQVVVPLTFLPHCFYIIFFKYGYNLDCDSISFDTDERSITVVRFGYIYIIFKLIDLLDTVFIILKKNNRQLSFLHCYHHFCMAGGAYVIFKWIPGGAFLLLALINSVVHVVMYFYYLVSIYSTEWKKSITWKKNITQLQLAQFTFLLYAFARPLFNPDCDFPKFWSWMMVGQNILMLYLFGKFYIENYWKKDKKKKKLLKKKI